MEFGLIIGISIAAILFALFPAIICQRDENTDYKSAENAPKYNY